uniref:Uncharacterized protein n=1 Tax=Setaria digitata TaxID=48799 RepID=A0A915PS37_9BILA
MVQLRLQFIRAKEMHENETVVACVLHETISEIDMRNSPWEGVQVFENVKIDQLMLRKLIKNGLIRNLKLLGATHRGAFRALYSRLFILDISMEYFEQMS